MSEPVGYRDVDLHGDAAPFVRGMRETATWPSVVELRRATRPALDAPHAGAVLDVGCGVADVLIDLAGARPDLRCVGVDVSEAMVAAARQDAVERGVTVDLQVGSATDLPFDDGTFDVVRTERMLQWLDDPSEGLAEIVRVTRPGGTVVAIDTDWRTLAVDLPDRRLERLAADVVLERAGADVGGRLRNLALDLGLVEVEETAATALITDWDPTTRDSPPGFFPPQVLREVLVGAGIEPDDADAYVEAFVGQARRGRLHVSLSMYAVVGRRR